VDEKTETGDKTEGSVGWVDRKRLGCREDGGVLIRSERCSFHK
jgi:hypothetical protein